MCQSPNLFLSCTLGKRFETNTKGSSERQQHCWLKHVVTWLMHKHSFLLGAEWNHSLTVRDDVPGSSFLRRSSFQAQSRISSLVQVAAFPGLIAYLRPHSWNINPQRKQHGLQLHHCFIVSACCNKSKLVCLIHFFPSTAWSESYLLFTLAVTCCAYLEQSKKINE